MKTISISVLLLLLFSISTGSLANPALNLGSFGAPSWVGFPPSTFFLDIVLQSEAQKLQSPSGSGLPEDLQKRVLDTMSDAKLGFDDCNAMATALPWMQIRCIVFQLQKSKSELKVIEQEAAARTEEPTAVETIA